MAVIDLENANKLKSCSNIVSNCINNIKIDRNNLSSKISNLNLDAKDNTNEALCRKVEQLKLKIDGFTNALGNISTESQQTATKLSIMK